MMGGEGLCYSILAVLVLLLLATVRNGWVLAALARSFAKEVATELHKINQAAREVASKLSPSPPGPPRGDQAG